MPVEGQRFSLYSGDTQRFRVRLDPYRMVRAKVCLCVYGTVGARY